MIPTIAPLHAANLQVSWTSDDPAAVSVNSTGLVTANLEGSATVTVTTDDGAFTAQTNVTVTSEELETFYAARLNGSEGERNGLAKSLSVMPGDVVRMEVFAKYLDPNNNNWTKALRDLIWAVTLGAAPAGTFIDGGHPGSTDGETPPYGDILDKGGETGTPPKAYLNFLVFDRDFNPLNGGYRRVTEAARESGTNGPHERLSHELEITEAGYVYIYLSNDNEEEVEVYFDDFKVEHVKSPVIQQDDYYPFGLAFNSYSQENSTPNDYKCNGKEAQNELGLGWLDYGARMYMPEIGKWGVPDSRAETYVDFSPYTYVANNPLVLIDPNGREITIYYIYYDYSQGKEVEGNASLVWKPGDEYDASNIKGGDNAFVKNVVASLQKLSDALDQTDNNYLKGLASKSKEDVDLGIREGKGEEGTGGRFFKDIRVIGGSTKEGSVTEILWDPFSGTKGKDTNLNEVNISPFAGLVHELGHADRWYKSMQRFGTGGRAPVDEKWSEGQQKSVRDYGDFGNYNEQNATLRYEHQAIKLVRDGSGLRNSHDSDKHYRTKGPFTTAPDQQ